MFGLDLRRPKGPGALIWLWISLGVVVLDQITKLWVEHALHRFQVVELLPFLNLTLLYNTGAAFSFLADAGGWQRWFFIVLASLVSVAIVVWLRYLPRQGEGRLAIGLSLILGGAVGNVIDRIVHGHVIDFIDVHWAGWHWPAFNVADTGITVGAALIIVDSFMPRRRLPK
jgi:signal peptidase II